MQSDNSNHNDERFYRAFISYRHLPLDRETAIRVQKRIENYAVPKEFRDRTGGKKLGACFRDEDELPASSSLSDSITYALDRSEFLIVICTPNLPESKWCRAEIRYFLQTHDRDHVLAVLADGTPEESFPDELLFVRGEDNTILKEVEPLAANVAGPDHKLNQKTFKKETIRLCAAMLGCPFDALWQRERRARTNRLLAAAGAAVAVMAVFLGVVMNRNARIEEQNVQIQAQVDQITEQNEKISQQNRELEKEMSSALVDNGISNLQQFDRNAALQNALDALSGNDPEVYDHRAEKLLADALMAYSPGTPKCTQMMWQTTDIVRISASEDGRTAFTADRVGNIYALNTETGEILWDTFLNTKKAPYLYPVGNDRLLCKMPDRLTAFSMKDGSVLWTYEYNLPNAFQAISDDGTLFAVLDWSKTNDEILEQFQGAPLPDHPVDMYLKILNTDTGENLTLFSIPVDPYQISVSSEDHIYDYAADFSDDNSCLSVVLPSLQNGQTEILAFLAKFGDYSHEINCIEGYQTKPDMVLGAAVSADNKSVYWTLAEANMLYSVISYADAGQESTLNVTNFTMSSPDGMPADYILNDRPYLPMLTSENLVVLISRNNVYIMDRSDGSLRYILALESPILCAVWLDREQESLEVLTENGRVVSYLLTYDKEYMVHDFYAMTVPASDLNVAYRVYDGSGDIYGDYILAVSASKPGNLLGILQDHDPDYQSVNTGRDTSCSFALPAPSGDRMMLFYPDRSDPSKAYVETIDIPTGKLLEEAVVSIVSPMTFPVSGKYDGPVPTDDSHFLLYGHLYGLDGSVADMNADFEDDLLNMAVVNEDGRLIYAGLGPAGGTTTPYIAPMVGKNSSAIYWWVDGKAQEASGDIAGSIAMEFDENDDPLDHFAIGKNSWMAGWGYSVSSEEAIEATDFSPAFTKPVVAEQISVVAINAITGDKVEVKDESTDMPLTHLVLSNRESYMACAYETGAVMIYNLRKKTSCQLHMPYAKGEIQQICFSDNDSDVLVLTVNGRVDVFPLGQEECAVSLTQCFAAPTSDLIDRFLAAEDPENKRLILTAANESGGTDIDSYKAKYWTTVLDTESWETVAAPDDVCCWSVKHGQAVIVNGSNLGTCRIHTLNDLTAWAKASLQ